MPYNKAVHILAIHWDLDGPGFTRGDFTSAESFASFDAVLVDPEPLTELWRRQAELAPDGTWRVHPGRDLGFSKALENLFTRRRREVEDLLLRGGGILGVRVRPPGEEVVVEGAPPRTFHRYSFLPHASLTAGAQHLSLPQGIRFLPRRGRDLHCTAPLHPLFSFLRRFSSLGYEAVLTSTLGAPLSQFGQVLAQNRVGDPLALDLPVGLGRILFLPAFPGAEGKEAGELLRAGLAALISPLPEGSPEWLEKYVLPGEEEFREAEEELKKERERLERREEELREVRKDYDLLRALLFPRGMAGLIQAVAAALSRLGFSCTPGPTTYSLIAEAEESFLVWAAYSPFQPAGPEEHRALLVELDRLRNEERRLLRGMLVALAEPRLDPKRRGPQWEEAVERAAFDHHLVLLSAADLFFAVAEVLGGADPKGIRQSLAQAEGPWTGKG